jgi:hypothetical protein
VSGKPKIYEYKSLKRVVTRIRDDLNGHDFVLLFAYNRTGKTRLSMEFKDSAKKKGAKDTLYFNAFTEDLFSWENDLDGDSERFLKINTKSMFFSGLEDMEMETRIRPIINRYVDFDFRFEYEFDSLSKKNKIKEVRFSREIIDGDRTQTFDNIKISRGEESIFIWCFFFAICELVVDSDPENLPAFAWVKNIYIDDPISSLDDNNAIAVATDLAQLLKKGKGRIRAVVSSHHSLFFNVMWNELKSAKIKTHFFHRSINSNTYILSSTDETPFFHHVSLLNELNKAVQEDRIYTYHFNMLRSILEKTAIFFGSKDFSSCIHGLDDEVLYARALNLLSHGKYSIYEPIEMVDDTKNLFKTIYAEFLNRYSFELPEIARQQERQT